MNQNLGVQGDISPQYSHNTLCSSRLRHCCQHISLCADARQQFTAVNAAL